jgi:hypothetical protein
MTLHFRLIHAALRSSARARSVHLSGATSTTAKQRCGDSVAHLRSSTLLHTPLRSSTLLYSRVSGAALWKCCCRLATQDHIVLDNAT